MGGVPTPIVRIVGIPPPRPPDRPPHPPAPSTRCSLPPGPRPTRCVDTAVAPTAHRPTDHPSTHPLTSPGHPPAHPPSQPPTASHPARAHSPPALGPPTTDTAHRGHMTVAPTNWTQPGRAAGGGGGGGGWRCGGGPPSALVVPPPPGPVPSRHRSSLSSSPCPGPLCAPAAPPCCTRHRDAGSIPPQGALLYHVWQEDDAAEGRREFCVRLHHLPPGALEAVARAAGVPRPVVCRHLADQGQDVHLVRLGQGGGQCCAERQEKGG